MSNQKRYLFRAIVYVETDVEVVAASEDAARDIALSHDPALVRWYQPEYYTRYLDLVGCETD